MEGWPATPEALAAAKSPWCLTYRPTTVEGEQECSRGAFTTFTMAHARRGYLVPDRRRAGLLRRPGDRHGALSGRERLVPLRDAGLGCPSGSARLQRGAPAG